MTYCWISTNNEKYYLVKYLYVYKERQIKLYQQNYANNESQEAYHPKRPNNLGSNEKSKFKLSESIESYHASDLKKYYNLIIM